jgi:hypothetical protein
MKSAALVLHYQAYTAAESDPLSMAGLHHNTLTRER